MRRARSEDLDRLAPLLTRLRAFVGLKETSRGVFYLGGKAFLHFHADPAGLFADVRLGEGFERLKVDGSEQAEALLRAVGERLG